MASALADLQEIRADKEMMLAASNPAINEPNGARRRILCQRLARKISGLRLSDTNSGEARELQPFLDTLTGGGFITNGSNWMLESYKNSQAALAQGSVRKGI